MANEGAELIFVEDLVRFGENRGLEKGLEWGLRVVVADLCEAFGIELGATRQTELEAMGLADLEALRATLKQTRRWPARDGALPDSEG